MKVQQINCNNQPNFGAKLSLKSMKTLSNEIEHSNEGNIVFREILERIDNIGNKKTVLDFGEVQSKTETHYYPGSAAYDYMDSENYEVTDYFYKMNISNSLFPETKSTKTLEINKEDNLFQYLSRTLFGEENPARIIFKKIVEAKETDVFRQFIDKFKEENPEKLATKKAKGMIDVIKGSFNQKQAQDMIQYAVDKDTKVLGQNLKTIRDEVDTLNKKASNIETQVKKVNNMEEEMLNIINSDTKSERQAIINQYI